MSALAGMSALAAGATLTTRGAPQYPHHNHHDDDHPDKRTQETAPIKDINVANPKTNREDEVTEQNPKQAKPDRNEPKHRPTHLPEGIIKNKNTSHNTTKQT